MICRYCGEYKPSFTRCTCMVYELVLSACEEMFYRIQTKCVGTCHPDSIECCNACLELNGFEVEVSE